MFSPRLSQIYIYPVKSCAGIRLEEAAIQLRGLQYDRRFMVVDAAAEFLTQRDTPKLALIRPSIDNGGLMLSAPRSESLRLSLHPNEPASPTPRQVLIWNDVVLSEDVGDQAADWFSDFLGFRCRLVQIGRGYSRPVAKERIPAMHQGAMGSPEVSFADAFPFLVLSEESLSDLNARLPIRLGMDRFRPNLVVAGCRSAYEEDGWKSFQINKMTFRHGGPCVRCVITTTDQITLQRSPEPLRTLARYRRTTEDGVFFGMNFCCEQTSGLLRVGEPIIVDHQPASLANL